MFIIMTYLNLMFLNSKNPMNMGLILIFQSVLMTIILGKMNLNFWLSFIIFLVFIGGMLILFFYMISLINNQFEKTYNYYLLFFFFIIILYYNSNKNYNLNYETVLFNSLHLNNDNSMNLIKLYNMPNLIINMMLVIYLFVMMIIVSKITNYNMGPFYKL